MSGKKKRSLRQRTRPRSPKRSGGIHHFHRQVARGFPRSFALNPELGRKEGGFQLQEDSEVSVNTRNVNRPGGQLGATGMERRDTTRSERIWPLTALLHACKAMP